MFIEIHFVLLNLSVKLNYLIKHYMNMYKLHNIIIILIIILIIIRRILVPLALHLMQEDLGSC